MVFAVLIVPSVARNYGEMAVAELKKTPRGRGFLCCLTEASPSDYLAYCAASSNLIEIKRDTESEPIVTPYSMLARDMVSRLWVMRIS